MKKKDLYTKTEPYAGMKNNATLFTEVLGDYPLIRVLDYLILGKDFDYSISDITGGANVGWTTIHEILPKLEKLGIVKQTRKIGMAKLYRINEKNYFASQLISLYENLMKESINRIIMAHKGKRVAKQKIKLAAR